MVVIAEPLLIKNKMFLVIAETLLNKDTMFPVNAEALNRNMILVVVA